ncbi:MAG: homoserine dehydrogenase [Oscillospiraceae bacterium]|jgi:homoserine dehydrogenase|nr:homoserine dehydrogenase [Oscillospiraceae bacterium]
MYGVAILGFGVVGSGVAEVLTENAARIAKNAGRDLALKYILDVREFPGNPFERFIVHDFAVIENDPEIRVVVETIGGVGVAQDFTRRALAAGKSVVTSNKELVAKFGYELLQIAQERGVNYLFEASVGGGIPILRPITQCLAANRITEVYGILNGTTNYILTSMVRDGAAFDDALRTAQQLGYAEQNPTSDIDGIDACRKICILADLCYGRHVNPDAVTAIGIGKVTSDDTRFATAGNYAIKLLGRAVSREDGRIAAYVAPHLVPKSHLLASVEGVMNAIVVRGNAIGETMFYGAGAGKLPTASAVVADVIDAAKHDSLRKLISWEEGDEGMMFPSGQLESRWYARVASPEGSVKRVYPDVTILGGDTEVTGFVTASRSTKSAIEVSLGGFEVLSLFRVLD